MKDEQEPTDVRIIAFRASPKLRAAIQRQAEIEGLPASAVVRRACLRDLAVIRGLAALDEGNRPTA